MAVVAEITAEEAYAQKGWAEGISSDEMRVLKGQSFLLQRPGNSALGFSFSLARRKDMTRIDGLQNRELHETGGIASLGIFVGKDGTPRDNPNAEADELYYMSDSERAELEAQHAQDHAAKLRKIADTAKKLGKLDEERDAVRARPDPPDYGNNNKKALIEWAAKHLDLEIDLKRTKTQVVELIETAINGVGGKNNNALPKRETPEPAADPEVETTDNPGGHGNEEE